MQHAEGMSPRLIAGCVSEAPWSKSDNDDNGECCEGTQDVQDDVQSAGKSILVDGKQGRRPDHQGESIGA